MQHPLILVDKKAASAQPECGGWGRARLISQLPQEEPLPDPPLSSTSGITRTVASVWKTPVKQSSLEKETKGGSQPHGHAAVGGWGMGTSHMKPHVRQAAPECGASPGGRAIKTNIFLLPEERH